jgi:phage recombination protein Bet
MRNDDQPSVSLTQKFANKYGINTDLLWATLKATAFRQRKNSQPITDEQMVALLIVADQYGLNPFTKEIYAYPDKNMGIIPVVSVDGWIRIINEHPQFDGQEFRYSEETTQELTGMLHPAHVWMEVTIHRKDRAHQTTIREYLDEVYKAPYIGEDDRGKPYVTNGPWQTHTRRFHRHKTLIQGARIAFGFAGIFDDDEAQRIMEREDANESPNESFIEPGKLVQIAPIAPPPTVPMAIQTPVSVAAEPVPAEAKAATAAPAPIAESQPAVHQPTGEIDRTPITEGMARTVRSKMRSTAITEAEIAQEFKLGEDFKIEALPKGLVNAVLKWLSAHAEIE